MVVDSIQSSDLLRYNLKLLNYDNRIYQYENLPTPIWGGHGQFTDSATTLYAPDNLRGLPSSADTLVLSWLSVAGASSYEVQVACAGGDWESAGQTQVTQKSCKVAPGPVEARVRATNGCRNGPWTTWRGDTTRQAPPAPKNLILKSPYRAGEASIAWNEVEGATAYIVSLKHESGAILYTTSQSQPSFKVTPELQEGGPYRKLSVLVATQADDLVSSAACLRLSDAAPPLPVISCVAETGGIEITRADCGADADVTGFVMAFGSCDNFTASQTTQIMEFSGAPCFIARDPGVYYTRFATRDAFYEIAKDSLSLNWTTTYRAQVK